MCISIILRGYSNCGLLERALVHNPANISCVVQPLQIKYKSIPIFERFIQLGKHVKIAINISIAGAFG